MKSNETMSEDLMEGHFVALDFETTGLDPMMDSIIEIGMVRMSRGKIQDTFSRIVNPGIPIPPAITQLTGIRDEDCKGQPAIGEILPEVIEYIGSHCIIAHNAPFDFAFLKQASRSSLLSEGPSQTKIMDTLTLSRMLLPWLSSHRLETVIEYLKIKARPEHRALPDAEATALIFLDFISRACALEVSQLQLIVKVIHGARDGLRLFFEEALKKVESHGPGERLTVTMPANIVGHIQFNEPVNTLRNVTEDTVEAFFREGGPLNSALETFENRTSQTRMAIAVARALNRNEFLVAEAGTGVGKSLAYAVPAVLWTIENPGHRIIITTHTKTLQDQLFQKELPLVESMYPNQFSAVLLKGRSNYLCLRRYNQLLAQMPERLSQKNRLDLLPVLLWADWTRTGDIEENPGFQRETNRILWSQINCDDLHCQGGECPFSLDCHLQNVRRNSKNANILVINHALLFSAISQTRSLLGEIESLIIDEAHQLERTATQYLGLTLSMGIFWDAVQWLYQAKPEEVGVLVALERYIQSKKLFESSEGKILQQIKVLKELIFSLLNEAQRFFQQLERFIDERLSLNSAQTRIRFHEPSDLQQAAGIVYGQIMEVIDRFSDELTRLYTLLEPQKLSEAPELENLEQELALGADRMKALREALDHFQQADYHDHIVWCEKRIFYETEDIILHSVPLDIAGILVRELYRKLDRCIMTSATLTIDNQFDYLMGRVGLDQIEADRVRHAVFGSPFQYREQALFLVPTFLPYPKAESFTFRTAKFLENLIKTHPKGTLVLMTSHSMLKEVYAILRPALESAGILVLGQGIDGSRSSILKLFRKEEKSVLLGTSSFWEGVDLPGSTLEILVIVRIPFDVPTDPVIEARMEEAEKRSGSGFLNFSVPEAVVRFRQGFGRLIRSAQDRGVVLLLDQRAVKSQYGKVFLSSLPVEPVVCDSDEEVMERIRKWF